MGNSLFKNANEGKIYYSSIFEEKYEIGVRMQDKGIDFPKHYHNFIEIVCQIDGESTHYLNETKYTLKRGNMLIIDPSKSHKNIASNANIINIIISNKFLNSLVIESAFDETVIKLKNAILNGYHEKIYQINDNSLKLINKIYNLCILQDKVSMYYLRQKILLIEFLINFENSDEFINTNLKSSKLDLITYIQSNIKTASLGEYSKLCNYSNSLISQKIKNEYNITFVEILQELRLKTATNMLISTNKNIDSIMHEIGYTNKTHFYELFKAKYHMTPNKYKNMYKI